MIEALQKNNKLIINSDIDGIISGLILQEFLGCEIVGFSNSNDKLWIVENEVFDYKKFVFIDLFVNNKNITCIDQHIVSYNAEHNELIKNHGNKINPNIIRGKTFFPKNNYYSKYPFGTVHFIISELERNNFNLEKMALFNENNEIQPIDFLLRADDTLLTSLVKYKENAKDWWDWLRTYSKEGKTTTSIINYVYSNLDASIIKNSVQKILLNEPYFCEKPDGGFCDILDQNNEILPNFIEYIDFLATIFNLAPLRFDKKFKIWQGIPNRINFDDKNYENLIKNNSIKGNKVFSYAFVKSYGQEDSFSYTYFKTEK